ncbi:MAG: hypothetical protein HC853_19470 [Anaerolineae bacterium]|nr:hypothetical protein [Anaerolineae bacterium]
MRHPSTLPKRKGRLPRSMPPSSTKAAFMQALPAQIREKVAQHGIRNVTLLTQAPNGTIGTMVDTSTGIEPFFSWTYYRKSRLGLHEQNVPLAEEWLQAHPGQALPDYFVTAMSLTPEEHVRVQAAIQRWVDSSISKTCNVPNNYSVDDVRKLYEFMYDSGCKGGTIYRDGSRDEQVLMLKEDAKTDKKADGAEKKADAPAAPKKPAPARGSRCRCSGAASPSANTPRWARCTPPATTMKTASRLRCSPPLARRAAICRPMPRRWVV